MSIEPGHRRRYGQHFTQPHVADLLCALCIRSAHDIVLDPACGPGDLLASAAARLKWLGGAPAGSPDPKGSLRGVELDPSLAAHARERLPDASIVTGDFLGMTVVEAAGVDAVVGNPPYVRQELLGRALKRRLAAASARGGGSGRADLHTYFWEGALRRLKLGGRLGFLTSATWLDAAYGETLRRRLTAQDDLRLVALIESSVESWFDDARVLTVLTIIDKVDEKAHAPSHGVRLVRLGRRLDEIVSASLEPGERLARFDRLAREIESGSAVSVATVTTVPQSAMPDRRWGSLLRAPALARELIDRAGDRLVPLADVATVRWGIKTGDDRFFFVGRDQPAPVEPRYLVPVVFNLMELDRLTVTRDQLRRRMLLLDLRETRLVGARALRHIRDTQRRRASHLRPTCRARERTGGPAPRRWFELRPGPPGAILWSIMQQYRHLAPLNPEGFPANDNLLLIDPLPGVGARLLAALLNSHLQALLKREQGRHRNEGMLKMQAGDVRQMLVPDPRRIAVARAAAIAQAFDAMATRPIGKLDVECGMADRRRLDRAVLATLGIPRAGVDAQLDRLYTTLIEGMRSDRRWELDAIARRGGIRRPEAPQTATATDAADPGSRR